MYSSCPRHKRIHLSGPTEPTGSSSSSSPPVDSRSDEESPPPELASPPIGHMETTDAIALAECGEHVDALSLVTPRHAMPAALIVENPDGTSTPVARPEHGQHHQHMPRRQSKLADRIRMPPPRLTIPPRTDVSPDSSVWPSSISARPSRTAPPPSMTPPMPMSARGACPPPPPMLWMDAPAPKIEWGFDGDIDHRTHSASPCLGSQPGCTSMHIDMPAVRGDDDAERGRLMFFSAPPGFLGDTESVPHRHQRCISPASRTVPSSPRYETKWTCYVHVAGVDRYRMFDNSQTLAPVPGASTAWQPVMDGGNAASVSAATPRTLTKRSGACLMCTAVAIGADHAAAITSMPMQQSHHCHDRRQRDDTRHAVHLLVAGRTAARYSMQPPGGFVSTQWRLPRQCAIEVACGEHHVLALTADGRVYGCGGNMHGQAGPETTRGYIPTFTSIHVPCAQHVHCGATFSAVHTTGGELSTWGNNMMGTLGYESTSGAAEANRAPRFVTFPPGARIAAASCGADHVAVLTTGGSVFAWGDDTHGQLGIGVHTGSRVPRPTPVDFGEAGHAPHIVSVSCGQAATMALAADGAVYVWGGRDPACPGHVYAATTLPTGDTPHLVEHTLDNAPTLTLCHGDRPYVITRGGVVFEVTPTTRADRGGIGVSISTHELVRNRRWTNRRVASITGLYGMELALCMSS